jgi:hypothetical protein
MEYLDRLPQALPQDGRVLVHNNVRPARRAGCEVSGMLQPLADALEVCDCGFAPELGRHYRVRSASPAEGVT